MRRWFTRFMTRLRFGALEGRLTRRYRRLQEIQVRDASVHTDRLMRDVADVLLRLQATVESVEDEIEAGYD